MKIKEKKELKFSNELVVGDKINIADLVYMIINIEDVFYHVPKSVE